MQVAKQAFEAMQVTKFQIRAIISMDTEFIALRWRACVKFRQNGVIKLYVRHDIFGPDRGRLVFLLFMQQLVSSDPYKMSLCTRVVCRGNVQPGTSLKKKKRKRRKKRKRKSALRKIFPPDESRATSTKIPLCFHSTELKRRVGTLISIYA